MIALEIRERVAPQQNPIMRGFNNLRNRAGEVLGRPPKPEPLLEAHEIPSQPVANFLFEEVAFHADSYILRAMHRGSKERIEDNFSAQMRLARQEYVSLCQSGETEAGLQVLSDLLAMASLRYNYREHGVEHLLERDFPTPESIAEAVKNIHWTDTIGDRGRGILLFGRRPVSDMTWFRRWLHQGAKENDILMGDITLFYDETSASSSPV